MSVPLDKPIICPVLVGRDAHLGALLQCLDQAKSGHGQAVLVTGEAGIGKSRLVAELKPRAEREGFLVLEGNCFELDRSLPYAPILDLLRATFAAADDRAHHVATIAPELLPLLPDLTAWRPEAGPSPTLDAEHEKRRLFASLVRVFTDLAAAQPVLVIIEDAHWSDDTSLELVLYLARRLAEQPILLLLTYRSDEILEGLGRMLAGLDRARLAAEIQLARLSLADVGAMLRTIDQEHLDHADLVAAVYELTEGNPFFIEEVLRSLSVGEPRAGSWDGKQLDDLRIPRSVDDAVQRRMARLSADARQVLTLAAVAGQRFDWQLLQALTGHDGPALLGLIKELMAAGLVVEESADAFAFRHALTRQAIYTGLLAQERRTLHREIAATVEQLDAGALEAHLADLAYHHYGAGQWAQALDYGRRAGMAAQRLHAPRTAIVHFTRALEAARRLHPPRSASLHGSGPHVEGLPPDLYLERGRAYAIVGDFGRARGDFETALQLVTDADGRHVAWQAQIELGLLWAARDYERTGACYQRALELAEALGDPDLRARSLNRLGNWLANVGRPAEALRAHHEALALVEAQGDDRAIAETLDLLGMAHGISEGDSVAASDHFARAAERFRARGDALGLISSLTSYVAYGFPGADELVSSPVGQQQEDCERTVREALRLAREIEWLSGEAYAEFAWGRAFGAFGEFGAALTHARRSLTIATEIEHRQWMCAARCILGCIHVGMLAPDAAIAQLDIGHALARDVGSHWWRSWGASYLAFAHLLRGAPAHAEAVLTAEMPPDQRPRNVGERWLAWAWGELALAQGRPETALRIADELLEAVPGPERGQPIPTLLKLRGEALLALGRLDEAHAALQEAHRGAVDRGVRPLLWQVHRAQARLHRAGREYAAARQASDAAQAVIAEIAASIGDDGERDRFERAALATLPVLPRARPPSQRRQEAERFGGLTQREREVAAEIGQGLSNREIAAKLFTAERTVASHVSHILAKLGLSSRAQIAIWARDHGLE